MGKVPFQTKAGSDHRTAKVLHAPPTLHPAPGRPHPSAGELPITPVQGSTSMMWQWLILPHVYLMGDLLLFHI